MLIHLGGDVVIQNKDVVAILDYSKRSLDKSIAAFLDHYEQQGKVVWITENVSKSIIITDHLVYVSPISSFTLNRRRLSEDQERGEH
ncbi:ABC-type iron transport system FetAB ATPase subunit [Caldalkalibacillus uzonensis]|uniref:ABC-type iron transport system FetAB ATPase subunit n=1 Tax=Caldalkalibacillus uzonensis TaxID=353224 RepID=A0ABU0CTN5_9BACI|nr:extracellular matrix/biofilm biosynthesis regulator RemA family protein [Caldalkalibacillus uzonensis]MDQ0339271.1 ABC-type iron transport system FetAB ATPase subunit [Caldalkalibacillus uzonensis]